MEFKGQQDRFADNSELNAISFVAKQLIALIKTATVVKVLACTNTGGVSPVGFVDVQPLVNQLDGAMHPVPYAPIFHIPYQRVQGGNNAVICDPQVGDIGIAVFADRDITGVKNTKAQANPGSQRKFDLADGIYIGGILNAAPVNYVQFDGSGNIVITSAAGNVTVNCTAGTATVNAQTVTVNSTNSTVNASAAITLAAPQVKVNP